MNEPDFDINRYLESMIPPEPRGQAFLHSYDFNEFTTTIKLADYEAEFFNTHYFLFLLSHSFATPLQEKVNILNHLSDISLAQIEALILIFEKEKQSFLSLSNEHPEHMFKLRINTAREWMEIESIIEQQQASFFKKIKYWLIKVFKRR